MLRQGATEYTRQNQVPIVCVIKCNEFSEGTLSTHLAHPLITARILLYSIMDFILFYYGFYFFLLWILFHSIMDFILFYYVLKDKNH